MQEKKWILQNQKAESQKQKNRRRMKSRQDRAVSLHHRQMKSPPPHRRPQQSRLHKHRLRPNLNHLLLSRPEKMVTLKHLPLRRKSPATTKWISPTSRARDRVDVLSARTLKPRYPVVSPPEPAALQH